MGLMPTNSKQPRFNGEPTDMIRRIYRMVEKSNFILPDYSSDTRNRDAALLNLVNSESLMSGVVSSAVSRDTNRGWTLSGSARQVKSYSNKLHSVNDGGGWRRFVSLNATSWYCTNVGYASEIGFKYKGGPAETLWHLDPTTIRQTGKSDIPLYYYPNTGKVPLLRNEYIHGNSMPSVVSKLNYAGFCAVERALTFIRIMIGLNRHQLEKLGVSPPKGIMLTKGISADEWNNSKAQANEERKNNDVSYFEGVLGIFAENKDADIDIIALSNLPDNFSLQEFVDTVMQVYALAFGYPVGEFWSIASGSFGRTGEMKEQQQQATAKGELDFALSIQEQLQTYFLPTTLNFQFEQRNDRGELVKAESERVAFDIIKEAYKTGLREEADLQIAELSSSFDSEGNVVEATENNRDKLNLITKEQAQELLALKGIIPSSWTESVEDVETTDLKEVRERLLDTTQIARIAYQLPDEPIIMYSHNVEKQVKNRDVSIETKQYLSKFYFPPGRVTVLWEHGHEVGNKYF